MADLAIGVSKTALDLVVSKVKDAVKEEEEQWQTVQRDLVFITGEFEMMQSFLNTADRERIKNMVVRTWVRQVRDLSYDVEDWIEFVLHLDTNRSWWWSWWPRLLPAFIRATFTGARATLDLDEAVSEIETLKAQVVDVSQRNMRYNLISDSSSNPVVQVQKTAGPSTRAFEILVDDPNKNSGLLDLAKMLNWDDKDRLVISICGSEGDLETISIIRNVYNKSKKTIDCRDGEKSKKAFDCHAWVKLIHPFNPREFIQSLMTQFHLNSCQESDGVIASLNVLKKLEATNQDDLGEEFAQKVNTQRYLVILEDMSSMLQWDAIKTFLPDKKNRSRIIVLTQKIEIARLCTGKPYGATMLQQFSADNPSCVIYKENPERRNSIPNLSKSGQNLFGRHVEINELSRLIAQHPHISVWGPPGVGKTALVRAVYDKYYNSRDRFRRKAWVNVSNPFNAMQFCWELIQDFRSSDQSIDGLLPQALLHGLYRLIFHGSASGGDEPIDHAIQLPRIRRDDPIIECRKLLRRGHCLVIIDGLQSKENWDWIRANLMHGMPPRCCVITVSAHEGIATYCAENSMDVVYRVKGLDIDAGLRLFKREGPSLNIDDSKPSKEVLHILSFCNGLPNFIIAMARHVAKKRKQEVLCDLLIRKLIDNFMHELKNNQMFDRLKDLFSWLHSNFHVAPQVLKKCIFYLSVFPQDSIIRRKRLVRRWIAEGYSKGTSSSSLEDDAEKLIDKLVDLGIMRPRQQRCTMSSAMRMTSWEVNSLFLKYITSGQMEDKTFLPLEVTVLDGECNQTRDRIGQHLAIGSSWERDEFVYSSFDFSRLRSLTVSGEWQSFFLSNKMRVLRVLDLEGTKNVEDGDIEQAVKLLARLKFLSLRGCERIRNLPVSLGVLLQLETLDIRETRVEKIPKSIVELRKLQYLRAGTMRWDYNVQDVSRAEAKLATSSSAEVELPRLPSGDKEQPIPANVEDIPAPAARAEAELPTPPIAEAFAELPTLNPVEELPTPSNVEEIPTPARAEAELPTPPIADEALAELPTLNPMEELRTPSNVEEIQTTARAEAELPTPTPEEIQASTRAEVELPTPRGAKPELQTPALVEKELPTPPKSSWTAPLLSSWFSNKLRRRANVGVHNTGIKLPPGFGKLAALHTLGVVDVTTAGGRAMMEDIGKLTQLRKLGVSGVNRGNSRHLAKASHLESLSLHLHKGKPAVRMDDLVFPENLQSLKLYGSIEKLPQSLKHLNNLRKLNLDSIALTREDMQVLEKLQKLHTLRLRLHKVQDNVIQFCDKQDDASRSSFILFPELQVLDINTARTNCSQVTFAKGGMEKLELLEVRCSDEPAFQLSGLEDLISLKLVVIRGSYDETFEVTLRQNLVKHTNKPVLKLEN